MKKLQCLTKYMFSVLVVFSAPTLLAAELQGVEPSTEAGAGDYTCDTNANG
jgi:hypothetical protein